MPGKSWSDIDCDGKLRSRLAVRSERKNVVAKALMLGVVCVSSLWIGLSKAGIGLWRGWGAQRLGDGGEGLMGKNFRWDQISATPDLHFHSCDDGYECAKLQLPLDYFKGTHPNHSVSLALIKLPARVSIDDPRYGGPILINPGGPGGSGIDQALRTGRFIQTLVDSAEDIINSVSTAKYFDIIGFDPRGVGETEPRSDCVPDSASRWSWRLREETEGHLDSSDAALGRLWAMAAAYGTVCNQSMDNDADVKRYMTTASVARDMLEVVEKHSEYVAQKKRKTSPSETRHQSETKLQYFGFSYGTYLGTTFASMFPDRVGRLILDGVVNSDDYNYSLGNGSLVDNERAMTSFYTYCALAGPEECHLASSNSSLQTIEARVHSILESLYHRPLPVHSENGPEIITYSDLKTLLFRSLYSPMVIFPTVAKTLHALERGSGAVLEDWASTFHSKHIYACPINGLIHDPIDPEWAILCSDGEAVTGSPIEEFARYWHLLKTISPTTGSIWATLRMRCNHWQIRPVHRFTGTFGANTSNPILFLSNTADPVTPLRSARIMHSRFPGSGLLVQDSAGHCATSAASACMVKAVREYFQFGKLPLPGVLCVPPPSPFSLNSTDPKSPFYEPELGGSTGVQVNAGEEIDGKSVDAAKQLQEWFAQQGSFWPTSGSQRVQGLLASQLGDGKWRGV